MRCTVRKIGFSVVVALFSSLNSVQLPSGAIDPQLQKRFQVVMAPSLQKTAFSRRFYFSDEQVLVEICQDFLYLVFMIQHYSLRYDMYGFQLSIESQITTESQVTIIQQKFFYHCGIYLCLPSSHHRCLFSSFMFISFDYLNQLHGDRRVCVYFFRPHSIIAG